MNCTCPNRQHDTMTALWHRAYRRWYDHDRAGHRVRAWCWGRVADLLVKVGDRIVGWGQ